MSKRRPVMTVIALLTIVFLYVPSLAVAVFSVNDSRHGLVWRGFTWKWYEQLFQNEQIISAALNSLLAAAVSTVLATVIGTALAIGLDRYPWGKKTFRALDLAIHLPVVVPDIIMAATLIIAFSLLRGLTPIFEVGMTTLIIGHITFQIAFVTLVVRSRLAAIGSEIYEAGQDLYASSCYMFRHVTLPLLWPGIVAGAMLAVTLSLDDFVISFFVHGPDSVTLPIYIYSAIRKGVTPEIHALSTLVLLVTVLLVIILERLSRGFKN